MNTSMMRCVVVLTLGLCTAMQANAESLRLDEGLINDVVDVVVDSSHGPIFDAQASPPPKSGGGGGGGGGGAKSLPPQLSGVGLGLQVARQRR